MISFGTPPAANEDINIIAKDLLDITIEDPIERGITALLAYYNRTHATTLPIVEDTEEDLTKLNIFTKLRILENDQHLIITDDMERFSLPLLNRAKTHEVVAALERISGKIDKYAVNIADEIIRDIETATFYPPAVHEMLSADQLVSAINDLSHAIITERNKASQSGGEA